MSQRCLMIVSRRAFSTRSSQNRHVCPTPPLRSQTYLPCIRMILLLTPCPQRPPRSSTFSLTLNLERLLAWMRYRHNSFVFVLSGISCSLSELFNRSFTDCAVPSAWKEALVVPVHKGGAKGVPSNYRPIALLSIVCKVMEKIVHHCLNTFLEPVLTTKQSGFQKKRIAQACNSSGFSKNGLVP